MRYLIITAVFTLATAFSAQAADTKIGTVDMQKALLSVEAGKKARSKLETDFNKRKKELEDEQSAIRKLGEDFKKQSAVLSEDARMKKQGEIQERVMKLQEKTMKSQQEIQVKEKDLTEPLVGQLKNLIAEIAKKKGYTIILEKSETSIMYAPDGDDITNELISSFNQKNKG